MLFYFINSNINSTTAAITPEIVEMRMNTVFKTLQTRLIRGVIFFFKLLNFNFTFSFLVNGFGTKPTVLKIITLSYDSDYTIEKK